MWKQNGTGPGETSFVVLVAYFLSALFLLVSGCSLQFSSVIISTHNGNCKPHSSKPYLIAHWHRGQCCFQRRVRGKAWWFHPVVVCEGKRKLERWVRGNQGGIVNWAYRVGWREGKRMEGRGGGGWGWKRRAGTGTGGGSCVWTDVARGEVEGWQEEAGTRKTNRKLSHYFLFPFISTVPSFPVHYCQ